MKTVLAVLSANIANPTTTTGPVAAGSAVAAYFLETNGVGQGAGPIPCLTPAGNVLPYAADLNGPSGGFTSGQVVLLAQTNSGRFWIQAAPGWQSALNSAQVNQQGPSAGVPFCGF